MRRFLRMRFLCRIFSWKEAWAKLKFGQHDGQFLLIYSHALTIVFKDKTMFVHVLISRASPLILHPVHRTCQSSV